MRDLACEHGHLVCQICNDRKSFRRWVFTLAPALLLHGDQGLSADVLHGPEYDGYRPTLTGDWFVMVVSGGHLLSAHCACVYPVSVHDRSPERASTYVRHWGTLVGYIGADLNDLIQLVKTAQEDCK